MPQIYFDSKKLAQAIATITNQELEKFADQVDHTLINQNFQIILGTPNPNVAEMWEDDPQKDGFNIKLKEDPTYNLMLALGTLYLVAKNISNPTEVTAEFVKSCNQTSYQTLKQAAELAQTQQTQPVSIDEAQQVLIEMTSPLVRSAASYCANEKAVRKASEIYDMLTSWILNLNPKYA